MSVIHTAKNVSCIPITINVYEKNEATVCYLKLYVLKMILLVDFFNLVQP